MYTSLHRFFYFHLPRTWRGHGANSGRGFEWVQEHTRAIRPKMWVWMSQTSQSFSGFPFSPLTTFRVTTRQVHWRDRELVVHSQQRDVLQHLLRRILGAGVRGGAGDTGECVSLVANHPLVVVHVAILPTTELAGQWIILHHGLHLPLG